MLPTKAPTKINGLLVQTLPNKTTWKKWYNKAQLEGTAIDSQIQCLVSILLCLNKLENDEKNEENPKIILQN